MALALTAEQRMAAPPGAVFDLFGAGSGAGWVFDAACDRLAAGAAVTLRAPLGGPSDQPVEMLGRITRVRPPAPSDGRVEIRVDLPWRGRLRLHFDADGAGTRVRIVADLDDEGLRWLMRRRGHDVQDEPTGRDHLVGLLTSKSGPGSVFATATVNLAAMAVEEINADGGLDGRPLELLVADDATDPATGALEAMRLVRAGCRTVFLMTTSATYVAASAALRGSEVLLVHTLMNEGGGHDRLRIRLGERPHAQLATAAVPLMRAAGGRRWFLAGNDYIWPRSVNSAARAVLPAYGATLVGERYAPLGTVDFAPIIDAVAASGADIVLNTFVGADAAAFERQCHAMGLRERALSLAPALDESTLERVGSTAAPGIHGISGYFQHLDTAGNDSLVRRYREAFGPWAPPLSTLSECTFEAVHMWTAAARRARTTDPGPVADEMRTGRFDLPRGTVTLDGTDQVHQRMYLAAARGGGFGPMYAAGDTG